MSEEKKNKGKRFVVLLFIFFMGMITALLIVLIVVLNLNKGTPTSTSSSEAISSSEPYQYDNEKKIYASLTNICNRFLRIYDQEIDKIYNLNFDNDNNIYLTSSIKNSSNVNIFKILTMRELTYEDALNHLINNDDFVCNEMMTFQYQELSICHTSQFKQMYQGTYKGIEMMTTSLTRSTSGICFENDIFYSINDLRYKDEALDISSSSYITNRTTTKDSYYFFISYLYFEI